jgi:Skp family chaperone for outer membrane proteins
MARTCPQNSRLAAPLLAMLALAIAAISPGASAALYKWVDANGRTVYSDQPPINVKAEVVGAAAPASNPDAVKELANKDAELKKRQSDKLDEAKKSDKARAEAQKLAGLCTQARAQASGLRRADIAMYRLNEKGERVIMDDATRKAEADRLDQFVKERNCPPA